MDFKDILLNDLNHNELKELFGVNDSNVTLYKELFNIDIIARGNVLKVNCSRDSFGVFSEFIETLIDYIKDGNELDENYIKQSFKNLNEYNETSWQNKVAIVAQNGKPIRFKTYNQYKLAKSLEDNDLVFSIGPAGTGKTFFAVVLACKAYKNEEVKKIILTRPAVEAGESLGFLPGDLKEKIDPYLMPLYDSLYEILGAEQVENMMAKDAIEIIPLAYMRGRTLNDSFIILDEAQNTTASQMLMFLTRLGYNSKMIVNGDITQIDLNINKARSGLVVANEVLQNTKKIGFVNFKGSDIVRNPLVETIINKFKL